MFWCFILGSAICLVLDAQSRKLNIKVHLKVKKLNDQVVLFPSNQKLIHSASFAMCSF